MFSVCRVAKMHFCTHFVEQNVQQRTCFLYLFFDKVKKHQKHKKEKHPNIYIVTLRVCVFWIAKDSKFYK